MNEKEFFGQLRVAGEIVKDWPTWKTDMWRDSTEMNPPRTHTHIHQPPRVIETLLEKRTK